MHDEHSKKLQGFRREIRREQIQSYKKNKRKQFILLDNSPELRETYWGVLRQHQLSNLKEMSYQRLQCHMQMLVELVFCQQNNIFLDALQKIMVILVDYYQEALRNWMDVARNQLERVSIDEIEAVECIDLYALTKVFSFIPVNSFLKILGGIYHDIVPSKNMEYLRKVVVILKDILYFSFLDYQRIRNLLQYFEPDLDLRLNKTIKKEFVLNALMNMAFSEEDEVVKVIVQENVFDRIMESMQTYGFSMQSYEFLAGLYGNCIGYLCDTFSNHPVSHEQQNGFQTEQMDSYHLYLPIFESLVNANVDGANQLLVLTANRLLEIAAEKSHLSQKEFILNYAEILARNIISNQEYYNQTEKLYILCAKCFNFENNPYPSWIVQLLSLILKNHAMVYFGQDVQQNKTKMKNEKVNKGKILRDINQILMASRLFLQKCDADFIEFQQSLVQCIIEFWCKEDFAMGSEELLNFVRGAIDHSKDLSVFIMFDRYQHEFLSILNGDYEKLEETRSLLQLMNSTCNRLEQTNEQKVCCYMSKNEPEWNSILMRIEGSCHTRLFIEEYYSKMAQALYERLERLQKEVSNK